MKYTIVLDPKISGTFIEGDSIVRVPAMMEAAVKASINPGKQFDSADELLDCIEGFFKIANAIEFTRRKITSHANH